MNTIKSTILTTTVFALLVPSLALADEPATKTETAYVDSVHSWGAWNLDLEPAAGGIKPPQAGPLQARQSKAQLRANSFAALAPPVPPVPEPAPVNPVPVIPTPPSSPPEPPPPPVVPPVGGPADGLF